MFLIVKAAIWAALAFVVRNILVKFTLYWGLFYFVTEAMAYLIARADLQPTAIQNLLGQLPGGFWYFMHLFAVPAGIAMIVSAALLRFMIRRIPLIG